MPPGVDNLQKALAKLDHRYSIIAEELVDRAIRQDLDGLNVKKLRGYIDTYRIRKSRVRVVYSINKNKKVSIIKIDLKDDRTYENL